MTTTTNIPKDFPFHAGEAERKAIIDWMKTRPECEDDHCVNRRARWEYRLIDEGLFTDITVVDRLDGTEFNVPTDFDSL